MVKLNILLFFIFMDYGYLFTTFSTAIKAREYFGKTKLNGNDEKGELRILSIGSPSWIKSPEIRDVDLRRGR